MKRRKFIANTTLGLAGASLASNSIAKPIIEDEKKIPVVISTWNNLPANKSAYKVIFNGGKAIDAVERGVHIPEADPKDSSVGFGGRPDRDGNVTLDACIMDHNGNCGSVSYLQHIKHPISVARKVMDDTPHVMLSGAGALKFAVSKGFKKQNLLTDASKQAWEEWKKKEKYEPKINIEDHDTIGMLAIDKDGDISGACTTSGISFKLAGRVGDSPVIGAGMYCDNEVGGACATGMGELVLKTLGSFLIVELMRNGMTPQEACEEGIKRIMNKVAGAEKFQIGYLALNKHGDSGAFAIHKGFKYALYQNEVNEMHDSAYHLNK